MRAPSVLAMLMLACAWPPQAAAQKVAGRWASNDNVALSTKQAGSKFFLDVTVAADGSFKGTWEQYVCFNYSGPYGIVTAACQRSRKPEKAAGRLDAAAGTGRIELDKLGKSSFRFKSAANQKGTPQLDIELPRDWLKENAPVLYEANLNPK